MPDEPRDQTWAIRMAKRSRIVRYNATICQKCGKIIRQREKGAHAAICNGRPMLEKKPFTPRYRFQTSTAPTALHLATPVAPSRVRGPSHQLAKRTRLICALARIGEEYARSGENQRTQLRSSIRKVLVRIDKLGTKGLKRPDINFLEEARSVAASGEKATG